MTMQFADSETQRLLRNTTRSYLQSEFPFERLYALEEGREQLGRGDVEEFDSMGWLDLLAPEEKGGGGVGLLDAAAVIEEFGYAGVPSPVLVSNVAAYLLSQAGHAAGNACTVAEPAFRGTEPPLTSNGGLVQGDLALVPFADVTARVLAPVSSDGETIVAALPLEGVSLEQVSLLDRRSYFNLRFDGTELDASLVLARGEEAAALVERGNALITALSLIETSGMMQRILEMTTAYISQRVQFGQPIAKFQAVRHRAAELLTQAETTRWSAYHALWRFQNDPSDADEIWLAKQWAVRACDRVFQVTHLLHGGVGVGTEHPLHLFTQGLAAFAVRGGTMNEMVARTIDGLKRARAEAS